MVKAKVAKKEGGKDTHILIKAPNILSLMVHIEGTAPLVMAAFSQKSQAMMIANMEAGSTAKSKKNRTARDFAADTEGCIHRDEKGKIGFPASAFRAAIISACRLTSMHMTQAKLAVFVEADGIDVVSGQPLVHLIAPKYEMHKAAVRNATGVADIRARPMWRKWAMKLRVRYDADLLTAVDVAHLLQRAGTQVGIGEGRPFSRMSAGMGWGTFAIVNSK